MLEIRKETLKGTTGNKIVAEMGFTNFKHPS